MKISLKILTIPLITTCVVAISIAIFYYSIAISPRVIDTSEKSAAVSEEAQHTVFESTDEESTHSPKIAAWNQPVAGHTSGESFVYPIGSTRDPFQQAPVPAGTQKLLNPAVKPSIMLTGIIWDEERPVAIITDSENNSYLVKTGEEIGKAKILAIRPRSITIESDGNVQGLVLWPAKF